MNCNDIIIGKKQDGIVRRYLEVCGIEGVPTFEVKLVNTVPEEIKAVMGCDEYNQKLLYMRKIDCVIETDDAFYVIEAKPVLNCEALGQALLYRKEWSVQSNESKPVKAVIACLKADATLIKLCNDYSIEVKVLE